MNKYNHLETVNDKSSYIPNLAMSHNLLYIDESYKVIMKAKSVFKFH